MIAAFVLALLSPVLLVGLAGAMVWIRGGCAARPRFAGVDRSRPAVVPAVVPVTRRP